MKNDKYPRFFDIDGLLVKLIKEGEEIVCLTATGDPYPLGKVLNDGSEITEDEFNRLTLERAKTFS